MSSLGLIEILVIGTICALPIVAGVVAGFLLLNRTNASSKEGSESNDQIREMS
jgi:hypothetical protein